MPRPGSTVFLSFPPLGSVIGLADAPPEIQALLIRRWMACEAPSEAPEGHFLLRWRLDQSVGRDLALPEDDPAWQVRWQPSDEVGALSNACGRVVLSPATEMSTLEVHASAVGCSMGLEPLVEAALAHALAARGECFLHAAALELGGRSILLIGESGSGKSTLAAAGAAFGGRVISDDSLLLGLDGGRPVVRAARRDVWLRPGSSSLVSLLRRRGLTVEETDDGRLRLGRDSTGRAFRDSSRPDCLVVVERGADSTVGSSRLSQAEGLAALLRGTSALYVTDERFAVRQGRLLELLTVFAERLPAVRLSVGSSLLDATEESLAAITKALP